MQEAPALVFPLETMNSGEVRFAGTLRFEPQFSRAIGRRRREQGRAGGMIGDVCGRLEFFLQRRGEQDSLGEITKFHCLKPILATDEYGCTRIFEHPPSLKATARSEERRVGK